MAIDCVHTIQGRGPALFLIHGIGARRSTWARLVDLLQDEFTCITYDLRGHGESPLPKERFGLEELVEDLETLRARLVIDEAHFAGHSLGGMIGPAYARRFPHRVTSLGLLSTAAFRTSEDAAKVRGVVAAMRHNGISAELDTLTARWFTDAFRVAHPEVIEWRKRQVLDTDPDVFLNVFDIYANTEMAPWLHEIPHPALVLTGELDGGCNPRLNKQIAAAMPHAELTILDNLKHAILVEAPERVAAPMRAFLSGQQGS